MRINNSAAKISRKIQSYNSFVEKVGKIIVVVGSVDGKNDVWDVGK